MPPPRHAKRARESIAGVPTVPKNRHKKTRPSPPRLPSRAAASTGLSPLLPLPFFIAGLVVLAIGLLSTGTLSLSYLPNFEPPGCAFESPCEAARQSAFSKVPGIGWPVAYLGFAFVVAMLVAWLSSYKLGIGRGLTWMARAGALISLAYLGLIIVKRFQGENLLCAWCIASHLANLGFLGVVEFTRRSTKPATALRSMPIVATAAVGFIIATAGTAAIHVKSTQLRDERDRAEAEESTQRLVEDQQRRTEAQQQSPTPDVRITDSDLPRGVGPLDPRHNTQIAFDFPREAYRTDDEGFTGRYRLGDADAPIRLVVLSSYTCAHCKSIEEQIVQLLRDRSDVSFSHKHVSMTRPCNTSGVEPGSNNDCWASRAAETAGILGGPQGFWAMHMWLFSQSGSFTDRTFPAQLRTMGFDSTEFLRIMQSSETLQIVQRDVTEARSLGITETPMIFINGVEFRGFRAPGALRRAVESLAQTSPPRAFTTTDQPPGAFEKYLEDWRQEPVRVIQDNDAFMARRGSENAPVQILAWIDYQAESSKLLDDKLTAILARRDDVSVVYRHFPANTACNTTPRLRDVNPLACRLARGIETAGSLGGAEAYWGMHEFILNSQSAFTAENIDQLLADEAVMLSLDRNTFLQTIDSPAISRAIQNDIRAMTSAGLSSSVVTVLINGRQLSRWFERDMPVLETAIQEAADEISAGVIP